MGIGGSNLGQSTEVERQRRAVERLWVDCQESGGIMVAPTGKATTAGEKNL